MPEARFTFNAKSLALGRVLIGTLVLIDLQVRAEALEAHYSDAGALPRDAYTLSQWDWLWSLHLGSGELWFQSLLFAATAAALLAFVAGWHTRLANAVAWLLYLSLCARNPFLRDGQDELGRVLLFFCLFLSLDGKQQPAQVRSAGTVAFTLQVCLIYWASVMHKLQSGWWTSGHAIENVVQMRRYQTPFAQWLQQFPALLTGFTWSSLALEASGPVALLVFWHRPRARMLVVASMIALHLGMWLNIRIGTFPPLCVAMWLMFLPTAFWGGLVEEPRGDLLPRWARGAALSALALVAWLNVRNLLHLRVPEAFDVPGRFIGVQQWWGVFAPTPAEGQITDGWFWAQGRTANGTFITIDVPYFTSTEPPPPLLRFQSTRWRHLLANLTTFGWPKGSQQERTQVKTRAALVRWLCRDWNRTHLPEHRLTQLYLFFFRHELGKAVPVTRELLGSGDDACAAQ